MIDPSIPLQVHIQPPDFGGALERAISLGSLLRRQKMEDAQMQRYDQEQQRQASLRSLFAQPGADMGDPEFVNRIASIDPETGMKLREHNAVMARNKGSQDKELLMNKAKLAADMMQAWDSSGRHPEALASVKQQFAPIAQQLGISPEDFTNATPEAMEGLARHSGYRPLSERVAEKKALGEAFSVNMPSYQFLQGDTGFLKGNRMTGEVEPVMLNGQPARPGSLNPELQGEISRSKAGGKAEGEARGKATVELPNTLAQSQYLIDTIEGLKNHPGLGDIVGVPAYGGIPTLFGKQPVRGTNAADFQASLDQTKGKAFLEAFNILKGGGQITEIEGEKATNAIARMQTAQSEKSFREALDEFEGIIRGSMDRAKQKAQGGPLSMDMGTSAMPSTKPPSQFRIGQTATGKNGQKFIYTEEGWKAQ